MYLSLYTGFNRLADNGCDVLAKHNFPTLTYLNLCNQYLTSAHNQIRDNGCHFLGQC